MLMSSIIFVTCRAKVVQAIPDPSTGYTPAARVLLLDEGRVVRVRSKNLYDLPDVSNLDAFPLELVEVGRNCLGNKLLE